MDNETLRVALNVIKYQISETFERAAKETGRELETSEALQMIELMGRLSNAQACLEFDAPTEDFLRALGQEEAWDASAFNRDEYTATQVFGPKLF